jgi:phosphoglycolate phosphatase
VLVVFDWDGTLCDSVSRIVTAMQRAAVDMEITAPNAEAVENIIGLGLAESVQALFPGLSASGREGVQQRYSQRFSELDHSPSPLFPGARKTLQALRKRGHQLAVATGKSRRCLDRVLGGHGMHSCFDSSRCADETRSKPHPEMLQPLLAEMGVAAEQALMVGDTEYDLEMAMAAGVTSVGVGYGVHSRARLARHKPLAIIEALPELLKLKPLDS